MTGVLVHQMPHPVHAAWARAAGLELHAWLPRAEPYATVWLRDLAAARRVPRTRLAVAEGGGPAGACVLAKTLGRVERAILLAADETWARLRRGVPKPLPATERAWWRLLARGLDGAIAVSPYVADDLRALHPGLRVEVVRPHIAPELQARLLKLDPALDGQRLLHLASTAPKNGTTVLLEAFARVRKNSPGAELHVVGAGSEGLRAAGVVAHGRVPDLAAHLAAADLFVLPGLGQACPVATLEAMAAGVPTLVSTETGTRDLVHPRLVAAPDAAALAVAITDYLQLAPRERADLAAGSRRAVEGLTQERQCAAFRAALARLAP
ncbi:MAG TPA: glycosyltransferase [Candidatus Thermoplasmatota archaeon]|jgi:glycosyltransferase involved in cell wall biosynthesis|nr:glycosyltransferase [Candidatus Thermoplasmatota archaeon]